MSQNLRLGAFIVVTLTAFAVGVFLIGNRESRFHSHYRVKADFQNAAGLSIGADVRIGGVRKGTVRSIQLPSRPNGMVTISMDLDRDTHSLVKEDSVASIQAEGMLGDKYVEVSFGSDGSPEVANGGTIQSRPPLDISDLVSKANDLLDGLKGAVGNVQGAAANIQNITGKINQGTGTVGALVNDKTMYKEATAGVTALKDDADALKHNFLLRGFFHNRGYEDSSDLTQNEISQLPSRPPSQTFAFPVKQMFDKLDTAKLKGNKSLDEVGKYLQAHKFSIVVIAVSAGPLGDSKKQQALTEAQAGVTREYLVNHFPVDDKRIKTLGLGKGDKPDEVSSIQILIYEENEATLGKPRSGQ